MKILRILVPLGALALLVAAYQTAGWPGVALVVGAIVMWLLLQFNRMMAVLRRAAVRPLGQVDSAVMLNALLRKRMALVDVIARTRSLGVLQTPEGVQPEVYRWSDNSDSHVLATFLDGKLTTWDLRRPAETPESGAPDAP